MASTNPTVKSCPTTGPTTTSSHPSYRFEPTGTYRPFTTPFDCEMPCPPTTFGYPVDMSGFYYPPTKTYSSIFNKMPEMMPETPYMPRTTPMEPMMVPPPTVYERDWSWPNPTCYPSTNWWLNRMPEWTSLPSTWSPYTPTNWWPMMTPRTWDRRMDLPCTPFERILYRFLNTLESWPMLRSNEWLCTIGSRPCNPLEFYCLSNPIRMCDRDGNRELCLCFDLRGYKPEEVHVTLNKTERCILVEAAHEVKEGKEHHVTRRYCRKFILPETLIKVDLSKCEMRCNFSPEGYLVIECTLPRMTPEEIAKVPECERYFTSPYLRDTVCPTTLNTPINLKPVNVKMC